MTDESENPGEKAEEHTEESAGGPEHSSETSKRGGDGQSVSESDGKERPEGVEQSGPGGRWAPSPGDMPGSLGASASERQFQQFGGDPNADAWREARMGVEDPNEPDAFQLTIPSTWSRGTRITTYIAAGLVLWWVAPALFDGRFPWWVLILLLVTPLLISMWMGYKKLRQPNERQAVIFGDDHVVLPKGGGTTSSIEVAYTDIWSVMVMMRGESQLLLVETEGDRVGLSSELFLEPDAPRRIKRRLLREISSQPGGEETLREIRRREENAREASDNPVSATYALLLSLGVVYLYQYASGALADQFQLLNLGANSAVLVDAGQWWRLISANFLHGGFMHLFLNGIALMFLGLTLERLLGSWRFVLLYLVSALGGAVGSYYWTQAHLSVGSSTAIFGLLGAFLVIHLKFWRQLPPPFRQTKTWWAVILTLNIGFSFLPFVDAGGHFGGLFVGMLVSGLMLWPAEELKPTDPAGGGVRLVTAVLSVLFLFGLTQAALYSQTPHPEDARLVYDARVEQAYTHDNSFELNAIAWNIAIDKDATREELELARRASKNALELKPERWSYRDTYSTVLYRLALKSSGEKRKAMLGEAITNQYRVFRESTRSDGPPVDFWTDYLGYLTGEQDPVYATQLSRFLEAYLNEFGVYQFGRRVPGSIELTTEDLDGERSGLGLRTDKLSEPILAYILGFEEKKRIGMVRVCLPKGHTSTTLERLKVSKGGTKKMPPDFHARLAATDGDIEECPDNVVSNRFWPTSAQIERLP